MISSTLACDALQGRRVKLSHCAGHFVLMVQHCARVHSLCGSGRGQSGWRDQARSHSGWWMMRRQIFLTLTFVLSWSRNSAVFNPLWSPLWNTLKQKKSVLLLLQLIQNFVTWMKIFKIYVYHLRNLNESADAERFKAGLQLRISFIIEGSASYFSWWCGFCLLNVRIQQRCID